jgi:hypothetical protein
MSAPVTHAPDDMDSLRGELCECTSCGLIAKPSFMRDFYVLPPVAPGKPLLCESCLYMAIAKRSNVLVTNPAGAS